jgi:hypothetical protein
MVHCGEIFSKNIIITNLTKKYAYKYDKSVKNFINEGGQDCQAEHHSGVAGRRTGRNIQGLRRTEEIALQQAGRV